MTSCRFIRSVRTKSVPRAGPYACDMPMMNVASAGGQWDARHLTRSSFIEEANHQLRRVFGINREIGTFIRDGRA